MPAEPRQRPGLRPSPHPIGSRRGLRLPPQRGLWTPLHPVPVRRATRRSWRHQRGKRRRAPGQIRRSAAPLHMRCTPGESHTAGQGRNRPGKRRGGQKPRGAIAPAALEAQLSPIGLLALGNLLDRESTDRYILIVTASPDGRPDGIKSFAADGSTVPLFGGTAHTLRV
uniref:Uncharacterized protein n=1 Tax=Sphaerodactylus townsendi TaxID=933632 RepID=A0ACB8F8N2_9SAUR